MQGPFVIAAASILAGAALAQAYRPGPENIAFPAGFEREFIRYATVDKPDRKIVRFLYVNREAFEAARQGEPLPYGTVIVMADKRARLGADGTPLLDLDGRIITEPDYTVVAVQQKERGWGEGYGPEKRNGEWEYASFTPEGQRRSVSLDGCFSCHLQARKAEDYAFQFWDYVQARRR
ncbi:cytochrome P460 family protein [Elioraea rosea]|uniref:cytochrome P460 family protein n=1 Tax=Elioraea rosea TaxID=2492390 RepID=UPI001183042F|nr:cytochrome P460 family protein [Elioraea rosea]